jgi:hypothetical protein
MNQTILRNKNWVFTLKPLQSTQTHIRAKWVYWIPDLIKLLQQTKLGLYVQNSTITKHTHTHTHIPLGAVHGGDDGIAGEDGGSGVGEHGVARHGRGGVQVSGSDQRLHAVVEVQPWPHQRRRRVRQPRRIRVTLRWALIPPERVQRRLDAQPALPAPSLRRGFLGRREREAARRCGLVFGVGALEVIEKWG